MEIQHSRQKRLWCPLPAQSLVASLPFLAHDCSLMWLRVSLISRQWLGWISGLEHLREQSGDPSPSALDTIYPASCIRFWKQERLLPMRRTLSQLPAYIRDDDLIRGFDVAVTDSGRTYAAIGAEIASALIEKFGAYNSFIQAKHRLPQVRRRIISTLQEGAERSNLEAPRRVVSFSNPTGIERFGKH